MKYKVGDKVRIRSKEWYESHKNKFGKIWTVSLSGEGIVCFDQDNAKYCGKEVIIFSVDPDNYVLRGIPYEWTDEMIEGLTEEDNPFDDNIPLPDSFVERMVHKIADSELFNAEPLDIPTMTTDFVKEHGLPCPEGYIFKDENGNIINATKIVLEKKKPKYPKTYEECCEVLDVCSEETLQYGDLTLSNDYEFNLYTLLENFRKLRICRDAYWKIAGEEMGLGKPWEPIREKG